MGRLTPASEGPRFCVATWTDHEQDTAASEEPSSIQPSRCGSDEAHGGALIAGHRLRLIAHLLDDGDDFLDFIGRGSMPHHDQHD